MSKAKSLEQDVMLVLKEVECAANLLLEVHSVMLVSVQVLVDLEVVSGIDHYSKKKFKNETVSLQSRFLFLL